MKDEDEDEDEVRTLKPHVELHESVIGFHEVSYERRLWPQASSLIKKETLKKRISNNEYRMSK